MPTRREHLGHRARVADDSVLRQHVERVGRHRDQAGERGGDDERAALAHPRRERLNAEDDAVDVDAEDAPVVVERPVALREHARVQADEVGGLDVDPRLRVGDVEAVDEVEPAHRRARPPRATRTIARPIPPAAPVTSAVSGNKNDLAGRAARADQLVRGDRIGERELGADDRTDRAVAPERQQLLDRLLRRSRARASSAGRGRSRARRRCVRRGGQDRRAPRRRRRSRSRSRRRVAGATRGSS